MCQCAGVSSGVELTQSSQDSGSPNTTTQVSPDPNAQLGQAGPPASGHAPFVVVGRATWPDASDNGHFITAWTGTTVGVRFFGTGLVVQMADTDRVPLAASQAGLSGVFNAWDINVDGVVLSQPLVASRVPGDVVAVSGLQAGAHEVWLTRRTEAVRTGRVEIFGVRALEGSLLAPPAPRQRRIEVVGTSVETGLHAGVSANDPGEVWVPNCPFHPLALNQNRAWPKLLAEAVNAELINTSVEGAGLILGFTQYAGAGVQLPGLYQQRDVFVADALWDPTTLPVDLVLAAAGWSDVNQLDPSDPPTAARLQSAYESFLDEIRQAQPAAWIYAVVRTSDSPYFHRTAMAGVIQAAVDSRMDSRIVTLFLPAWSSTSTNCDDHPNWTQHGALAAAARSQVNRDLGW